MNSYLYISPTPTISRNKIPQLTLYYLVTDATETKPSQKYKINETAYEIIQQFDGTKTYNQIIEHLSGKYNESKESIEQKIKPFLIQLEQKYGYYVKIQHKNNKQKSEIIDYTNIYPTVASLELTDRCNIKCRHCYGSYDYKNSSEMSIDNISKLLHSFKDIGIQIVELTGGEPTVHPEIAKIIKIADNIGIPSIMLLTNGIHITDELLDTLITVKNKVFVQVDLHSLDPQYYDKFTNSENNLSRVISNIERLVRNGIRIRVTTIITSENVDELVDIAKWSYDHGAILYAPSIVTALGRASDTDTNKDLYLSDIESLTKFNNYLEEAKNKFPSLFLDLELPETNCGVLTTQLSINTKGDIKLCSMDTGTYFNFELGNVFLYNIKEIYDNNKDFIFKMSKIKCPDKDSVDCKDCDERFFCSSCILRGMIGANRTKNKCNWYNKLDPIIKERLLIK